MRSTTPSRFRPGALPAVFATLLLLGGCMSGPDEGDSTAPVNGTSLQEEAASASQSLGLLMDASSEAALASTAAAVPPDSPVENAPDLTALNGVRVFDLATLRSNGQPLFSSVTTAGTITVTHAGTAIASSPMGSTTLYSGIVTVALTGVVITNGNGDELRLPSGTFSYALSSSCTTTDAANWVIDQSSSVALSPPLSASVTHAGHTLDLTIGGNRTVHQVITRESGVGVNRRTVLREISGTTDGHPLSDDPLIGGHSYATLRIAVEGVPVSWSRFAGVTTTSDYTQPAGSIVTVSSSEDFTFITIYGIVLGPRTASEWGALLRARLQAEFL